MNQKSLQILIASTLLASASSALALPFNSFDPRSMGMGGTGVAVGDSSTAPFFNPALLTITHEDDLFSVDLPIVGARIYDPDNFETSLDDFQNGNYVDNMDLAINGFSPSTVTSAQINAISSSTSTLSTQFATLSDKPIQGELGAGLVIGVPSKDFGIAFYANGWGAIGGTIKYNDDPLLQSFIATTNSVASAIQNSCGGTVVNTLPCSTALLASLPADTNPNPLITTNQFFTIDATAPTPTVTSSFNSNSLTSSVNIRGVVLSEVGVSLSTQFGTGSAAWGLGITPKVIRATLIDYSADVNTGSTNNIDGDDYSAKYTSVNFDLGLAKDYANGWRAGFVVKNILPRSFDFKSIAPGAAPGSAQSTTGTLKLRAQARVGTSYSNEWSTVALDVDLTSNDPAGFESPSKYVALGAELDAWGWAQLRLGYRVDVKNSNRNAASVGVGLSPYGVVHFDLAAVISNSETGGSARLAFTF
ncbi:MAG: conjugal transfer protein TraF [Gallionella sp.]